MYLQANKFFKYMRSGKGIHVFPDLCHFSLL